MKKNVIWYEGWVGEFLNVGRNIFFFLFFSRLHFRENYIWKLDKLLVKFVNFQFDTSAQSAESYFIFESMTKIFPFENLFFLFFFKFVHYT